MFSQIFALIITGISLIYGASVLIKQKEAMYFTIVLSAVSCYALGKLYCIITIICIGGIPNGFHPGHLALFGCFCFLLSANYGQMDRVIDDKDISYRRYRIIAGLAPLCLLVLLIACLYYFAPPTFLRVAFILIMLPGFFSVYLNLKHIIFPDLGLPFVEYIRPCNITALIFTYITCIDLINGEELIFQFLSSVCCALLVPFSLNGSRKWRKNK